MTFLRALILTTLLLLPGAFVWAAGWEDVGKAWDEFRAGRYEQTVKLTTGAIKSGTLKGYDLGRAYGLRGLAYRFLHQSKKAVSDLRQAIELYDKVLRLGGLSDERRGSVYNSRGTGNELLDRRTEAIADYAAAIQAGNLDAHINRGRIYFKLRRYRLALADYDAVVQADPDNSSALYSRARTLLRLGDYGKAIADYDRALAIDPKNPSRWKYFVGRGNAHMLTKAYAKAVADYQRALQLNPNFELTRKNLARARAALKGSATGKAPAESRWQDLLSEEEKKP